MFDIAYKGDSALVEDEALVELSAARSRGERAERAKWEKVDASRERLDGSYLSLLAAYEARCNSLEAWRRKVADTLSEAARDPMTAYEIAADLGLSLAPPQADAGTGGKA